MFLDPPYDDSNRTFTGYTSSGFGLKEQERLAEIFKKLSDMGCFLIETNHDTERIRKLYDGFRFIEVQRKGAIMGKGKTQREVIITNC